MKRAVDYRILLGAPLGTAANYDLEDGRLIACIPYVCD